MSALNEMTYGYTYDFSVYAIGVLGTGYKNVKFICTLDMDSARYVNGFDPISMHRNVYSSLPPGAIDDPSKYLYLKIQYPNGSYGVVGEPWIDASTIQLKSTATYEFTVEGVEPSEVDSILAQLAAIGKTAVKVTAL